MNVDGSNQTELVKVIRNSAGDAVYPPVTLAGSDNMLMFMEVQNLWDVLAIDINKVTTFPEQRNMTDGPEGLFKSMMTVPGGYNANNPVYNSATNKYFWAASESYDSRGRTKYYIRSAKYSELLGGKTTATGKLIFETKPRCHVEMFGSPMTVSPDGTKLILSMLDDSLSNSKLMDDLYLFDTVGDSIIKNLTNTGDKGYFNRDPNWSPDGKWIAWCSGTNGKSNLWVMDATTNDRYQLTTDTNFIDFSPVWSPDSKHIAFSSTRNKNTDIYMLDFVNKKDTCDKTYFEFPVFSSDDSISFVGDANIINNCVRLTKPLVNKAGALWYKKLVPLKNGFSTEFRFKFTNGDNNHADENSFPGADGIAFVIQNDNTSELGFWGGGIGYELIPNSLAVEYDLFANDSIQIENLGDPNGNHLAIMSNGINPNSSNHKSSSNLALATNIPVIRSDGTIYYSRIEYNQKHKQLKVYIDTTGSFQVPSLTLDNIEINKLLNLFNDEWAYVGFTAATGIAFQNQDILSWNFCPAPTTSILSDVIDNNNKQYNNNFSMDILNNLVEEPQNLFVYDILGRNIIIYTQDVIKNISDNLEKDLSERSKGIYFVVVKSVKNNYFRFVMNNR